MFQTIIDEGGRAFADNVPAARMTRQLTRIVEEMIASLEAWMTPG